MNTAIPRFVRYSICANSICTNYFYWPKQSICTNVIRFVRVLAYIWVDFLDNFEKFWHLKAKCLKKLKSISKSIQTYTGDWLNSDFDSFLISICMNFSEISKSFYYCNLISIDMIFYEFGRFTTCILSRFLRNALLVQTEGLLYSCSCYLQQSYQRSGQSLMPSVLLSQPQVWAPDGGKIHEDFPDIPDFPWSQVM